MTVNDETRELIASIRMVLDSIENDEPDQRLSTDGRDLVTRMVADELQKLAVRLKLSTVKKPPERVAEDTRASSSCDLNVTQLMLEEIA